MSVRDALDDYARRMDTDGAPHVAFVIEGHGFEEPRVRVLSRAGRVLPFEQLRSSGTGGKGWMTAPWTIEDLDDCARFLSDIAAHLRHPRFLTGDVWATAVPEAIKQRDRRRSYAIKSEMSKAAYESERPWVCLCGGRWKTERGMKQHQRACWQFDPITGQPKNQARTDA